MAPTLGKLVRLLFTNAKHFPTDNMPVTVWVEYMSTHCTLHIMHTLELLLLATSSLALEDSCRLGGGGGTGPMDHWPTVESAEACKLQHCGREMVRTRC